MCQCSVYSSGVGISGYKLAHSGHSSLRSESPKGGSQISTRQAAKRSFTILGRVKICTAIKMRLVKKIFVRFLRRNRKLSTDMYLMKIRFFFLIELNTNELIIPTFELHIILNIKKCPTSELTLVKIKINTRQMNSMNQCYKICPTNQLTCYKNKKKIPTNELTFIKIKIYTRQMNS